MLYDDSLRFFHYVMAPSVSGGKIGSYLNITNLRSTIAPYRVFRFMCFPRNKYFKKIASTYLGTRPLSMEGNLPPVKLIPPNFSKAEIDHIAALIADPSISFIAFPTLVEALDPEKNLDAFITSKCSSKPKDLPMHMVLVVYNKAEKAAELWDDMLPLTQRRFRQAGRNLNMYVRSIFETLGMEVTAKGIIIPTAPELRVDTVRTILETGMSAVAKERLIANTEFQTIYSAFLVNYIKGQCKDATARPSAKAASAAVMKRTLAKSFIPTFETYLASSAPKTSARSAREISPSPCPDGQVRNAAGDCEELDAPITMPMGSLGLTDSAVVGKHPSSALTNILMYLMTRHPEMTTLLTKHKTMPLQYYYALRWIYDADAERRLSPRSLTFSRWSLNLPPSFDKFMKKAMAAEHIRFIAWIVSISGMQGASHANCVILDKKNNTIERFEPNGTSFAPRDINNAEQLDEAIRAAFAPYAPPQTAPQGFTYRSAYDTSCPTLRGFHYEEWMEYDVSLEDMGGNCALWNLWLMDLRLTNPDVSLEKLYRYAHQQLRKTGSYKHFINGYFNHLMTEAKAFRGVKSKPNM